MPNFPYPRRRVLLHALSGGLGISLLLTEAHWQMLRWAERQDGYTEHVGLLQHLLEIVLYTLLSGLLPVLLAAAVCIKKRLYRNRRGVYIIFLCATAVFLVLVAVGWLLQIISHYVQTRTLWLPPDDFGSALAYLWLWLCIGAVMLAAWFCGAPPEEKIR